jgi:hypothetical protein
VTTVQRLDFASHVALLDPMTGEGRLILPEPSGDLALSGSPVSLHAADWGAVVRELDRLGWEPSENEDGGWLHCGRTSEGRDVVSLYGREPVITEPSIENAIAACVELDRIAGTTGL